MPVGKIFEALIATKYQGFVDLEYEIHPDDPMPGVMPSFAYMRGVLAGMGSRIIYGANRFRQTKSRRSFPEQKRTRAIAWGRLSTGTAEKKTRRVRDEASLATSPMTCICIIAPYCKTQERRDSLMRNHFATGLFQGRVAPFRSPRELVRYSGPRFHEFLLAWPDR